MCVPVVLDLVVGPPWDSTRYQRPPATTVLGNPNSGQNPRIGLDSAKWRLLVGVEDGPVAEETVETEDEVLFVGVDLAALD